MCTCMRGCACALSSRDRWCPCVAVYGCGALCRFACCARLWVLCWGQCSCVRLVVRCAAFVRDALASGRSPEPLVCCAGVRECAAAG
eukprot:785588-Prymnesium_polylepis.2